MKEYKGPGLAIQHVEIEGPLVDEFPSKGHKLIFDGLNCREIMPRNPADRQRSSYQPKFELVSADPPAEITPVLQRERPKLSVVRWPPSRSPRIESCFKRRLPACGDAGRGVAGGGCGYSCSPEVPHFQMRRGASVAEPVVFSPLTFWLDDFSRLRGSPFLTRSTPDEELLCCCRRRACR